MSASNASETLINDIHDDVYFILTRYNPVNRLKPNSNFTPYSINGESFHHYCDTCFKLIGVLYFSEKYGKILQGETIISGDDKTFSIIKRYLNSVKTTINRFITTIDGGECECRCNKQCIYIKNELQNALHTMETLTKESNYKPRKNYNGHGPERSLYRKYHLDFLKIEEDIDGEPYFVRDINKINDELIHWRNYFNQTHYSIIRQTKKALKKTYLPQTLNKDIICHILTFV